jgi:SET domain-containing protein 6
LEILEDGYCVLHPSAEDTLLDILPDELLALLKTLTLDSEELQRLLSKSKPPKPILAAREARILLEAAQSKLAQYSTTIQEDQNLLQQFASSSVLRDRQRRRHLAVEVRLGEKEVLQALLMMLQDFLAAEERGTGKRAAEDSAQEHQKKAKHHH